MKESFSDENASYGSRRMSKKYIDADDIEYTKQTFCYGHGWYEDEEYVLKEKIDEMPAADVRENVRGEWKVEHGVMMHDDIYGDLYRCSECGHWERDVDGHNFCLNCGADMRQQSVNNL